MPSDVLRVDAIGDFGALHCKRIPPQARPKGIGFCAFWAHENRVDMG